MPIRQHQFSIYEGKVDKDTLFPAVQDGRDVLASLMGSGAVGGPLPVGSLIPSVIKEEPEGWLICDGRSLSRVDYPNLFDVIGTTYGPKTDDGATFNLPDFRNRTIWGAASTSNLDPQSNYGKISAGLPNITGAFSALDLRNYHTGAFSDGGLPGQQGNYGGSGVYSYRTHNFNASKSNAIYGNSTTVQPPAIAVNVLIKC